MSEVPQTEPAPVAEFAQQLVRSLIDGSFTRLVLTPISGAPGEVPIKIIGRAIELRGESHLSLTYRYATRDEVKNLPVLEVASWFTRRAGVDFGNALLGTTTQDWQLQAFSGKRPRLIRHKSSGKMPPPRTHDQAKRSLLTDAAHDWLAGLGLIDGQGRVKPVMASKYSQVQRYVELMSHLLTDAGWPNARDSELAPATIVDMGAGKGYLTFGIWHLCRRVWQLPVRVLGIERRPELAANANQLAKRIGASELEFRAGDIEKVPLRGVRALIALHACDTATDAAIRRGIEHQAQVIVVAPCCHKEVRPQLGYPEPLGPVLRHGIMAERMAEWTTDGLRSLFLEWAGYRTKMLEFISSEHTPKNLMIAAIREREPFTKPEARDRILDLKRFFGIQRHALDLLLESVPLGRSL